MFLSCNRFIRIKELRVFLPNLSKWVTTTVSPEDKVSIKRSRVQRVAQKKEDMKSRQTQRRNESISKVINSVKEVGITIYRDLLRPTLLTALGERKVDLVKLLLRPKEEIRKEPTPEVQRSIFSIARLLPFPFSIFFKDSRN